MVYTHPVKDNVRNLTSSPTCLNLDMAATPAIPIIMMHISYSIVFAEGKNRN